jgi:hypothetical protein
MKKVGDFLKKSKNFLRYQGLYLIYYTTSAIILRAFTKGKNLCYIRFIARCIAGNRRERRFWRSGQDCSTVVTGFPADRELIISFIFEAGIEF